MDPIGGHVRQTGRGMGLKLFVLVSLLLKPKFISESAWVCAIYIPFCWALSTDLSKFYYTLAENIVAIYLFPK